MKTSVQVLVAFLFVAGLIVVFFSLRRTKTKNRVLPPPRSKGTERSYQETNSVARLFIDAISIKDSDANWVGAFKVLNPDGEPHIRTILLELRELDVSSPRSALESIEAVCIESKSSSKKLARAELLELSLLCMRSAKP